MTRPSRLFEPGTDSANQNEQEMPIMPVLELVKPCAGPVHVKVEIAMEWALLGGD